MDSQKARSGQETSRSNTEVPTLFTKEPTLAFPGFPPSQEPMQLRATAFFKQPATPAGQNGVREDRIRNSKSQ